MIGKFEVTRSSNNTFMFHLRADNGSVILASPAYENKDRVMQAIEEARGNAAIDDRFQRLAAEHGKASFLLKSASGEVLGHGQAYASTAAMENGIASVARNGMNAVLVDMAPTRRLVALR
ncbi:MAG: YegP family protein [Pseudomonadota bacterium]|nr:YegP family protein [Pseudomonadota bacterium]